MNNLKDIHNPMSPRFARAKLFYQDFNEQFEGYTQPPPKRSFFNFVVLSGFQ